MKLKELAKINQVGFKCYVFKEEEVDSFTEGTPSVGNGLFLSHLPSIEDLFALFWNKEERGWYTFDPARPQWWNDQYVNTPEYWQTIWIYDRDTPVNGRAFNPRLEWKQAIEDLALKVWTENQETGHDK